MTHLKLFDQEWKNFTFKILTLSEFPTFFEHFLENYTVDEPINVIVGQSETKWRDQENILKGIILENFSFAFYDKTTGKIAAACIINIVKKDKEVAQPICESSEFAIIRHFLKDLDKSVDIFEHFKVDHYGSIRIVSVGREFRHQGLATKIFETALHLLEGSGIKVVKSVLTNPHTRAVCFKLGFKEYGRIYHNLIKDLQGNLMHPHGTEQEFTSLSIVQLGI